jgi:hypothetical protein
MLPDTGAECLDPSGVVVSQSQRHGHAQCIGGIDDVQVRVAHAGRADADENVARARFWLRKGPEFGGVWSCQSERMHEDDLPEGRQR